MENILSGLSCLHAIGFTEDCSHLGSELIVSHQCSVLRYLNFGDSFDFDVGRDQKKNLRELHGSLAEVGSGKFQIL